MTVWTNELDTIKSLLKEGKRLEEIGKKYKVSKQRIYQILTKFGIDTPNRKRANFLRDKEPKYYWLSRILCNKKITQEKRLKILNELNIPDVCPILGFELNYNGVERAGWTRGENSPSIDRIDSNKGYEVDNLQIISWRANRIKNDSTPEELMLIAKYMQELTKKDLQL